MPMHEEGTKRLRLLDARGGIADHSPFCSRLLHLRAATAKFRSFEAAPMSFSDSLLAADIRMLSAINGLAGHDAVIDRMIQLISSAHLVKGMVPALIFWCLWFMPGFTDLRTRLKLITVLVASVVAIIVGRALAVTLPFRDRPIHTDGLLMHGPLAGTDRLETWSSLPSDHAVLYFALAAGLLLSSRAAGVIALLHAAIVIALPRAYLGLHYPGDLIVGAGVGLVIGFTLVPLIARWGWLLRLLDIMLERYPFVLYPAIFFVTFNFATMFDQIRRGAEELKHLLF